MRNLPLPATWATGRRQRVALRPTLLLSPTQRALAASRLTRSATLPMATSSQLPRSPVLLVLWEVNALPAYAQVVVLPSRIAPDRERERQVRGATAVTAARPAGRWIFLPPPLLQPTRAPSPQARSSSLRRCRTS